ncbi:Protein of unknown function, partial [Gryllus bimaculatus]
HIHESLQQRCHENEVHRVCIGRARTLKRWDEMQIKMRKVVGHASLKLLNLLITSPRHAVACSQRARPTPLGAPGHDAHDGGVHQMEQELRAAGILRQARCARHVRADADPVNVEVQCELPSLAAPARVQARRHSVGAWSVEAQEPKEHTGTATLPCISNKVFSITHL